MSEITDKRNDKTNIIEKMLTRKFIRFISICSFVIIVFIICDAIAGTSKYWFSFGLLREPASSLLVGFTIVDGIEMFSGRVNIHSFSEELLLLNSILVYFVLSPFLLLTGLREYFSNKKNNRGIFKISKVKIYIGTILLINLVINSSYMLYYVPVRHAKLVKDRSRDSENFRIRKNIQQLAATGIQMYIFKSENLKKEGTNVFIPEFEDFRGYEWLDNDKYTFIPFNNNDTLFTVTGVGNAIGKSADFINANGDTGKVQESGVIGRDGSFIIYMSDN